jgi:putative ABC transport system ATP-binding protein
MPAIECLRLRKAYRLGKTEVPALRELSCTFDPGEFVALSGPSGSGKSTLLNLLGLVDRPSGGELRFDGKNVASMGEPERTRFRGGRVGFVFQNFNLIPILTIRENIEFPLSGTRATPKEARRLSARLVEETGLAGLEDRFPAEVSGGQRQRAAVARALIRRPRLLLADEPTANLDSVTGQAVIALLRDLARREGSTVIMTTHDPRINELADRRISLRDGVMEGDEREARDA